VVGEAGQALPHLAVLVVRLQPQMDLDWAVPHAGLAMEQPLGSRVEIQRFRVA
jgi:hypothetical protein